MLIWVIAVDSVASSLTTLSNKLLSKSSIKRAYLNIYAKVPNKWR